MKKRWVLKKPGDYERVNHLAERLGVDNNIANMLVQRGIYNFDEARAFFRPDINSLHDPFLMKDMDKAVDRIEHAINNNEKILIYGDYDVDGTTAVSLVYTFLKQFSSSQVDFYIPDRYSEGYGISYQGIDYASQNNFKLIIALDCGIKAVEKVAYAKTHNVDFIICDHHRPGDNLPLASAVLDPKRDDCNYPFKELSGCGVGFKLIQAYSVKKNLPVENLEKYLDFVVVSIAADIVPITGENRTLAYHGLKLINSEPRPAFEAILKHSNVVRNVDSDNPTDFFFTRELSITDLVFLIGPRINAAGRIESGRNSVQLLISDNMSYATELADQIDLFNTERRHLDALATQQALEFIANDEKLIKKTTTVVYDPSWHQGVVGIVASRLTETYYRPTIVLTKANGLITGSARSVKDYDIYDAIDACSDLLEHFGGHKYAAGLSLKEENLEKFMIRFDEYVMSTISEELLTPEIEIDLKINLNEITPKFYRILRQFAPFGPGNMKPVFLTVGVADTGYGRVVGKNHLKLTVAQPQIRSFFYPAIAFQQGDFISFIDEDFPFNICYHIEENEWNGNVTLQLNIKDMQRLDKTLP